MTSVRDYNLRILRPLGWYLLDQYGKAALNKVCSDGGITSASLDGSDHWTSTKQFENVLAGARALMKDDDEFKRACTYRLAEAYGAMRFVMRATSPDRIYRLAVEKVHFVCTISKDEILESKRNSMHVRWRANPKPSRLVCLSRQAQSEAIPPIWGLPPAVIKEDACMAFGDEHCDYKVTWYNKASWWPAVWGASLGGLASIALQHFGLTTLLDVGLLGLITGGAGYFRELRTINILNQETDNNMIHALTSTVEQSMQMREELVALHKSQSDWSRILEEENRDRTEAMQKIAEHFQKLEANRTQVVRGYSHDLRNPLQVMRLGAGYLKSSLTEDKQAGQVLEEIDWAIQQMNELLVELNKLASQPTTHAQMAPQVLDVTMLTDRVRGRLRALAYGKDLRTTAFSTREAPQQIRVDPTLYDRVLDNLLTNAIKYTERGSIIVEMDGAPGFLVVKVSDTGRGIAAEELERSFAPGGSNEQNRAAHSLGIGLSVVVQLLARIGGRLEIMSKPSVGTTFWLHFPVDVVQEAAATDPSHDFGKVVSIRRIA